MGCGDENFIQPKSLEIKQIEVKIQHLETKRDSILDQTIHY